MTYHTMKENNKNKKKEYVELTFLYFRFRNLFNYGWQKYHFFKVLIAHICNIKDFSFVRRIFENMIKRNIFDEKKCKDGIYYLFNPTRAEYKEKISDTIVWDT